MTLKLAVFTEADAKQRMCPMSIGHPGLSSAQRKCYGAECMAWRWALVDAGITRLSGDTHGFCGLGWPPDVGGRLKEAV